MSLSSPFFKKMIFGIGFGSGKIIFLNQSIFYIAPNSPRANASKIAQWLLR